MAQIVQLATSTLSNQNISAPLLAHTLTNISRIREIQINIAIDQVAGGGDYIAYITLQRAGAGSAYESARMAKTALSGTTSVLFQSQWFTINATDVVKVYVLGLAGDTTTPDIVTDINEKFLDDTGATFTSIPNSAGVTTILADYARRTGDYATVAALSTLQGNVTTILADYARRTGDYATVAALLTLQGNVTAILTDYARRTGDYNTVAPDNADIATILADLVSGTFGLNALLTAINTRLATSSYTAPDNADITAILADLNNGTIGLAALLAAILAGGGGGGSTAAQIWAYASRTLTMTAAQLIAVLTAGNIALYNNIDIDFTLSGLVNFTGWNKIWFTVKGSLTDADSAAILQLVVSNPAAPSTDGLAVLNGAPATLANGSLVPSGTTALEIKIKAAAAQTLAPIFRTFYDVKALIGTTIVPISEGGICQILGTVTKSIQ